MKRRPQKSLTGQGHECHRFCVRIFPIYSRLVSILPRISIKQLTRSHSDTHTTTLCRFCLVPAPRVVSRSYGALRHAPLRSVLVTSCPNEASNLVLPHPNKVSDPFASYSSVRARIFRGVNDWFYFILFPETPLIPELTDRLTV
jgi:hypothetical protein